MGKRPAWEHCLSESRGLSIIDEHPPPQSERDTTMQRKLIVAFFLILAVAMLAIFVSAQSQAQPDKDQERLKAIETRVERLEATVAGLEGQIAALRNPPATAHPIQ